MLQTSPVSPLPVSTGGVARGDAWLHSAISRIEADFQRSADTHLITLNLAESAARGIDFYLKDKSTHPTGSLKHRLARSLFLYTLCNGMIHAASTIVEASSGSTAVSEAYFARLLGLRFIAVMPRATSPEKVAQITHHGGSCHWVDSAAEVYDEAGRLAHETGGHYTDQFTYTERATDWRGNNNIAQSMFSQMAHERHPVPRWIVLGAGTGDTSATIGRFVRYQRYQTQLCVADPQGSVFSDYRRSGDIGLRGAGSRIEGIGRPQVEASFIRSVIDRMIVVADVDPVAAMQALSALLGKRSGHLPKPTSSACWPWRTRCWRAARPAPSCRCYAIPASATCRPITTAPGLRKKWAPAARPLTPLPGTCGRCQCPATCDARYLTPVCYTQPD
ncbi:MAG: PLP-dependent cysteine synthase family protein [Polaromonas sp.]|nr:PLP-dependent cysteine synthase family protein [Polaromonas sp.]